MYGNDLKFIGVSIGTDIHSQLLGYKEGDPLMESWEQFFKDQVQYIEAFPHAHSETIR